MNHDSKDSPHIFSILVYGPNKVGKKSILSIISSMYRMERNSLSPINMMTESETSANQNFGMRIWASGAGNFFRVVDKSVFGKISGVFVVYDMTNLQSFDIAREYLDYAKSNASEKTCIALLGNKCEREEARKVSYEEGRLLAEKHEVMFLEVSAKAPDGILHAFKMLMTNMMMKIEEKRKEKEGVAGVPEEEGNKCRKLCNLI